MVAYKEFLNTWLVVMTIHRPPPPTAVSSRQVMLANLPWAETIPMATSQP